jgi:hypothetical protein
MALSSLNKHSNEAFGALLQSRISEEADEGVLQNNKNLLSANQVERGR